METRSHNRVIEFTGSGFFFFTLEITTAHGKISRRIKSLTEKKKGGTKDKGKTSKENLFSPLPPKFFFCFLCRCK